MSRLTERQRVALALLADGGEWSPDRLAHALGTTAEGAGATAASLVRLELAERLRIGRHQPAYAITTDGLAKVRHDQLELP